MKLFSTHKIVPEYEGLTIEQYLKQVLLYSGRKLQKLTRLKGVRLNGKPAFLQRKLKTADQLQVMTFADTTYGVQPEPGQVDMLYEDEYLMVLNKPAGQLVHPTGQTTSGTLANYLAFHLQQHKITATIRPIHRLDRDTSGCVIFAKNAHSQALLEQQLKEKVLQRTYLALVKGVIQPAAGTIDAPIGPHPSMPNRRAITRQGQTAVTNYQTIHIFPNASLVELSLETGRTHQIRLHLAHVGFPIIGDGMYGIRSSLIARQALHATSVAFNHLGDHRKIIVTAPLAIDIENAINKITN
ncbi:pseudouridine synthase [Sporomusaceae bacterium FL31]|nr:pseudouridine synthase [Sporomusaceae bacterium FL31]GCE35801.1 pseudouridine synthase [Sporomusaceae bacterium]